MVEELTNNEKQAEKPAPNNVGDGNKPETVSILERADGIAKRLEEANKKAEETRAALEKLYAHQMLSGRAEAGFKQKTAAEVEKEKIDAEVNAAMKRFYRY